MLLIKPYWKITSLLIGLLLLSASGSAQTATTLHKYEITVAGFNIGSMEVEEKITGSRTDYALKSLVSFWLFGRVNVDFTVDAHYQDGQLIRSETNSDSNRGQYNSKIYWKDDHYVVDAHTYKFDNQKTIDLPIYNSTAKFYFNEPKANSTMMSEVYGLLSNVTQISKGVYEIEIDGNHNQFHYENGVLEKVIIQNPIKNYQIKRIK